MTFAHCSLPWFLLNVLAILSDKTAPEGQVWQGNIPVHALASALCWTKKAGNQNTLSQSHVHAFGPIRVPHGVQKQQGANVSPLFIVSSFRSEAADGEPTSHSHLQKPSSSLFIHWQTWG